jgi:hypothetical protein
VQRKRGPTKHLDHAVGPSTLFLHVALNGEILAFSHQLENQASLAPCTSTYNDMVRLKDLRPSEILNSFTAWIMPLIPLHLRHVAFQVEDLQILSATTKYTQSEKALKSKTNQFKLPLHLDHTVGPFLLAPRASKFKPLCSHLPLRQTNIRCLKEA